jgi:hypothetical protein
VVDPPDVSHQPEGENEGDKLGHSLEERVRERPAAGIGRIKGVRTSRVIAMANTPSLRFATRENSAVSRS